MTKPLSLKQILATLLTIAALFAGQNAWAQNPPTIGNITYNTEGSYYEINDTQDLAELAQYVNSTHNCSGLTFKMTANITFQTTTAWDDDTSEEDNFTAIGDQTHGFRGTFDGDGHTIKGIRIYKPEGDASNFQGLFGNNVNGIIKNVTLSNARITGHNAVGGIVGQNSGTVENCYVKASAVNGYNYVGSITGINYIVSIAGINYNGTLSSCQTANDKVNGNKNVGGIAGNNSGTISYCIAGNTSVTTANESNNDDHAGVILGQAENTNSNLITNYYYNCKANGTKTNVGCGSYIIDINQIIQHGDIAENHGAVPCYEISLNDGCIATNEDIIIHSGTPYACQGLTIVLTCTPPQGLNLNGFTVTSATVTESNGTYTFVMPATNVTINAIFLSTGDKFTVSYINEHGNICTTQAKALDNTMTTLGGTYVVNSNVTYDNDNASVEISGRNVTLILADGCTMSIGTASDYSNRGIVFSFPNSQTLTIYGQSLGTGYLKIFTEGNSSYGIQMGESGNASTNRYYQYSGNVFIRTKRMPCIYNGYIYLYGGTLDVMNAYQSGDRDINSFNHTIYIYGGKFWANGNGVGCGRSSIILGWTNPTDLIYSKNYKGLEVRTKNGQTLTDGTNTYSGTLTNQITAIKDKTLRPCYTKEIAGYENSDGGWAFISSPVAGSIEPTAVGNLIGGQIPESTLYDYDLYRFNQSPVVNSEGEYLEWQNYHQHTDDFNLVNGQGYLYATKDTTTLVFTGAFNMAETQDVPLVYETTNPDTRMHGWNLIGNPFGTEATVGDRAFYRMNEDGNEIIAATENTIAPMEGIFVKATGLNDTVTFTQATRATNNDEGRIVLNISGPSTGSGTAAVIDRAIVRFGEGQTLPKFQIRDNSTKIYIPQGSEDYAVVSVGNVGEMPVNFKAKENGEYTITVNPEGVTFGYLHLIDNMTGADVDLLALRQAQGPASYTFTAKTTDYESRFKLVFSVCGDANDDNEAPFAYYANGEIIIVADACDASLQVVDVMGRILVSVGGRTRCGGHTRCVPTSGMTPGIYVLRLIDGENVKTQKIVIK